MSTLIRKLAARRAEHKAEQRRRAIMLQMLRELNEMAGHGLLAPEGEK